VDVDVAETGHAPLVKQKGLHRRTAPYQRTREGVHGETILERLRTQPCAEFLKGVDNGPRAEAPHVAPAQLAAIVQQQGGTKEASLRSGRVLNLDTSRHAQMGHEHTTVVKDEQQVFAPAVHPLDSTPVHPCPEGVDGNALQEPFSARLEAHATDDPASDGRL